MDAATTNPTLLREAFVSSIPEEPSQFDEVEPRFVYVPSIHRRALEPNAMLVVGGRGAGKSFWWHTLQNADLRSKVIGDSVDTSIGFGSKSLEDFPDKDELRQLLDTFDTPRLIWKTVFLHQLQPLPGSWRERVTYVVEEPSEVASSLRQRDTELRAKGKQHLVLFDALDRTADAADDRTTFLRGLLELILELRSYAALRAKAFIRPDMIQDPRVRAFPDSSKLLASAVPLEWRFEDLYALLFQYLGNAKQPDAVAAFRELASAPTAPDAIWTVPPALREDVDSQQKLFTALAGPYMGTNPRRGKTYTWIPNHLADADYRVSPRSFLAAMRTAAMQTNEGHRTVESPHALHWRSLQEGVRAASNYRVYEIQEDLPWAHTAMEMLANTLVPCTKRSIMQEWSKGDLLTKLPAPSPKSLDAVLDDLKSVGIVAELPDGRLNIPDVYRIGFKLRRKGGLKPGL